MLARSGARAYSLRVRDGAAAVLALLAGSVSLVAAGFLLADTIRLLRDGIPDPGLAGHRGVALAALLTAACLGALAPLLARSG